MDQDVRTPGTIELAGESYHEVLARLHRVLDPRRYFEVGTETGMSLMLAGCAAVAVDPRFQLRVDVVGRKPSCALYQMPSDRFFAEHDPTALLGGPIDLAFLDGMHLAEFLLRDFGNTERHCRPNSVIALHDCLPCDPYVADREMSSCRRESLSAHPNYWTGDVWKAVLALRRFRPDLSIHALDAVPTGLVLVTNLDPASDVLRRDYARITAWCGEQDLDVIGSDRLFARLDVRPTRAYATAEDIFRHFWL